MDGINVTTRWVWEYDTITTEDKMFVRYHLQFKLIIQ
jgi:hypothetical protein